MSSVVRCSISFSPLSCWAGVSLCLVANGVANNPRSKRDGKGRRGERVWGMEATLVLQDQHWLPNHVDLMHIDGAVMSHHE